MSHCASVDIYKRLESETKRYKENKKRILNNCTNELNKIKKNYKSRLHLVSNFVKEVEDYITIEDQKKALVALENLKIALIKAEKLENKAKLKRKVKLENLKMYMTNMITEEELPIFGGKISNVDNLMNNINLSESDNEFEKSLNSIKENFDKLLNKYDKIQDYITVLNQKNFVIDDFKFDNKKDEFYVYASKDGKTFDCSSEDDKLNLYFDGYEEDMCLEELEQISKIADELYDLTIEIENYESKPIDKAKTYVNKSIGGN